MSLMDELASRTLALADTAHRGHWAAQTLSAHLALGELYEAARDGIDEIVEVYQGEYGLIAPPMLDPVSYEGLDDFVTYLIEEYEFIEENRAEIAASCPAVENLLDGLMGKYNRIRYKLEHLK